MNVDITNSTFKALVCIALYKFSYLGGIAGKTTPKGKARGSNPLQGTTISLLPLLRFSVSINSSGTNLNS
jgi:hypothetical protein